VAYSNLRPRTSRLDSWKEIAGYLHRDVRTVIRWEKERSLPVHRLPGGKQHGVFAYPEEIDAWLLGQSDHELDAAAKQRPSRKYLVGITSLLLACMAYSPTLKRLTPGFWDNPTMSLTPLPSSGRPANTWLALPRCCWPVF